MADPELPTLTTRVLVEIRDELRGIRHEHGSLLAEHGRKLDEHGRKLDEHGRKLDEHGRLLADHTLQLTQIRGEVAGLGVTLRQVLHAVEVGNARRDERVDDHESRITRLERHSGLAT